MIRTPYRIPAEVAAELDRLATLSAFALISNRLYVESWCDAQDES